MDVFTSILQPLGIAAGAITGTYQVVTLLAAHLRQWSREQKTATVLAFVKQLGVQTDEDVREAVKKWSPPGGVSDATRQELVVLLTNLARGARFHSTNGTPVSSYLRCERLIEQLLQNIQPKRNAGDRVGDWALKTFLGMGSFGEVWRAENLLYPNPHVFKFFTQDGAREWLAREANALRAVKHHLKDCSNVIDYLDVAITAEPYPYLVLAYADQGSLEDSNLKRPDDRPDLNATELMRGVVRGVAAAHGHHIYHRDLKPANVLLGGGDDPVPKVADFGLSRVDARAESHSSERSEMILVGTRMYHPPEASDPFRTRHPAQDDVFALGVIWFQVLTGELVRPPYDFVDRLHATAGVDSRTVRMVSRCLAHPDRRYPSACELFDDLDVDTPPGPGEWAVPDGCFDVAGVAREYLERGMR